MHLNLLYIMNLKNVTWKSQINIIIESAILSEK